MIARSGCGYACGNDLIRTGQARQWLLDAGTHLPAYKTVMAGIEGGKRVARCGGVKVVIIVTNVVTVVGEWVGVRV